MNYFYGICIKINLNYFCAFILHIIKRSGSSVLVRMPACHAGGRGFESRPDRNEF